MSVVVIRYILIIRAILGVVILDTLSRERVAL